MRYAAVRPSMDCENYAIIPRSCMRKFNFYPGPSAIPTAVMERFRDEFLAYQDTGASFIELSHRSKEVLEVHNRVVANIRAILGVDESYHVLLLPGGAIGMYAGIPMNLAGPGEPAEIAVTGHWSNIARDEMAKYCKLQVAVDTTGDPTFVPDPEGWAAVPDSRFLALVDNETIHGVEFARLPSSPAVPLVVDQSSNIFSRPIDMSDVGVLFACLQKNLGPSGLGIVVVRAELCGGAQPLTPRIWDFAKQAAAESMVNTIPTFQLRMVDLCLDWIAEQGGVERLAERNAQKSALLYGYIDGEDYYTNNVDPGWRSRMNVPFILADEGLNGKFVVEAEAAGLLGLKGHRAVGGMRASIYNAMPREGVEALIAFMQEFARVNG